MFSKKVSVVIPTYNRAQCILQSIQSVLKQTYSNVELIVVDDGSTDETESLIRGISDHRVRYIYKENGGACSARNRGIEEAKGDYIAFQDSDDWWADNKLELQLKALNENVADVCICRMKSVDSSCEKITVIPPENQELKISSLLFSNFISTQMIVAKKKCFDEIRFDTEMPRLQDWDLCIRLMGSYSFTMVNEVLVQQNIGKDSISKKNDALIKALERILMKYSGEYEGNKKALSNVEKELGNAYAQHGSKKMASHWYKRSMIDYPNIKAAAKLALLRLK